MEIRRRLRGRDIAGNIINLPGIARGERSHRARAPALVEAAARARPRGLLDARRHPRGASARILRGSRDHPAFLAVASSRPGSSAAIMLARWAERYSCLADRRSAAADGAANDDFLDISSSSANVSKWPLHHRGGLRSSRRGASRWLTHRFARARCGGGHHRQTIDFLRRANYFARRWHRLADAGHPRRRRASGASEHEGLAVFDISPVTSGPAQPSSRRAMQLRRAEARRCVSTASCRRRGVEASRRSAFRAAGCTVRLVGHAEPRS